MNIYISPFLILSGETMVFGIGGGSGCTRPGDVNYVKSLIDKLYETQSKIAWLRQQEAINPREYEQMLQQYRLEAETIAKELVACVRTIPGDPKKALEQFHLNGTQI